MRAFPLIICFSLILLADLADAQSFYSARRERSLMIVGGIGSSTYYGDLRDPGDFIKAKPALSVGLRRYFFNGNPLLKRVSFGSEVTWFMLQGDDAKSDDESRIPRNLSFSSSTIEWNAAAYFDLFPRGERFHQRPRFNVYGFVGFAGVYFNPKAELDGKKYTLQPLETEGVSYSRITFTMPYGLGIKYMFDPYLNVCLEMGYRVTFTDYIDDVSTVYLDNATLTGDRQKLADRGPEIGKNLRPAGAIRGNPNNNDGYLLVSVKVEYYLPKDFLFPVDSQRKLYNRKRKAFYRKR
jgi:hypothetical protein